MAQAKAITREEANTIIADWAKGNNPHKRITCTWHGQWYDLRELCEEEIDSFIAEITGIKPTPENTLNISV